MFGSGDGPEDCTSAQHAVAALGNQGESIQINAADAFGRQ